MVGHVCGRVAALCVTALVVHDSQCACASEPAVILNGVSPTLITAKCKPGVTVQGLLGAVGSQSDGKSDRKSLLAALLKRTGVVDVHATIDPPAKDVALAASIGLDRYFTFTLGAEADTQVLAGVIASEFGDLFESVEADGLGRLHSGPPNDPGFGSEWHLFNTGPTVDGAGCTAGDDVHWLEAVNFAGEPSQVIVAVLDTGVSLSHPDLLGQQVPGRNTTTTNQGQVGNTDDSTSESHGTKCAGVIAATRNNGVGIAGVAPNAKVMPIKVQNAIFLTSTYAGNGLIWATDHGAKVASMSFGLPAGTSNLQVFRDAVTYASSHGVVMVASTGNTAGAAIGFPAAYPEVIAVGSTNCRDQLSAFTTTGTEMDIVAPGENIYTTVDQSNNPDGYGFENGTSFAAPMVAAVAALVWGVNPNLSADQVRTIVVESADDLGSAGYDGTYAAGRLNAYNAVREAIATLPRCRVDYNGNRVADTGDLFYFFDLYFLYYGQTQGIEFVDFNGDGRVDVGDMFAFIDGWFRGC